MSVGVTMVWSLTIGVGGNVYDSEIRGSTGDHAETAGSGDEGGVDERGMGEEGGKRGG